MLPRIYFFTFILHDDSDFSREHFGSDAHHTLFDSYQPALGTDCPERARLII